jgi:hypothetical protein
VVIGLLVAAYAVVADLANFVGQLNDHRLLLFGSAGMLAAGVALVSSGAAPQKKELKVQNA